MKTFTIERSKKGLPVMWEMGGGATNTGDSQVIAGPQGEALTPLYIKTGGHLAGGQHALFVVGAGTIVVSTYHHRGDFKITVSQLTGAFGKPDEYGREEAEAEELCHFSRGEWGEKDPDDFGCREAVQAATDKAQCYHCREPHFMQAREAAHV